MLTTLQPLLAVDGDNFAHRSYHALPKSIRRKGGRGGGAIVGFANFLLRLCDAERPRAVLLHGQDPHAFQHRFQRHRPLHRWFHVDFVIMDRWRMVAREGKIEATQ